MQSTEVSLGRRLVQVACAIFWCLLSGGPIFGFAALKPVLVREQVYEYVCDISINSTSIATDRSPFTSLTSNLLSGFVNIEQEDAVAKCTAQDLKLNMMFTVGAVLTNVSALVIGRCLDVYGPRFCGLVGAGFLYLACIIFIFASKFEHTILDPYLIGYGSMALGGPFAYISSFQLSNSFPKKSGTILALLTGAFDASSALFLIYRILYNESNGAFTIQKLFKLYFLVPLFITLAQVFVMPKESYKAANASFDISPSQALEDSPLLENGAPATKRDSIGDALKQPYAEEGEATLIRHSGGIFGILHGYSARFQMRTPWFYLMCCFTTIQMLRLNYFVATINTQYTYLFHSVEKAEKLNKFFDILLPLGGVISIPFVGLFLDYCSTFVVLVVLLSVSLAIGFLGLFGSFVTGIINVLLFVVYRPLFYTTISDFCAKVFGFDTFGTVYGAIICTSGIFNFGQTILDKLTHTKFHMNPTPVNVMLVATTVIIGIITILYVKVQTKLYNEKKNRQLNAA
ncbi:uncharacterized protein PRCAT00003563001 [Priceomyces carsonii]|uniref:uncharacterized protein n=1 Tax=Priceomyces carsonii TaxID=28549 RepID=UPI002ED8653F|nr:unnamed protein product [Priceomyces carsonii]